MRFGTLLALVLCAAVSLGLYSPDRRSVVYVRNESSLSNASIEAALPAFQKALSRDFASAWHKDARLVFIGRRPAPKGERRILFTDSPNCLGCDGFHDGIRAEVSLNGDWQDTFSHELFEMLADPAGSSDGNGARMIAFDGSAYLVEVSDPVAGKNYKVDGVTIADFVTPAWFGDGPGPYDQMQALRKPLSLTEHGYAYRIGGGWVEMYPAPTNAGTLDGWGKRNAPHC